MHLRAYDAVLRLGHGLAHSVDVAGEVQEVLAQALHPRLEQDEVGIARARQDCRARRAARRRRCLHVGEELVVPLAVRGNVEHHPFGLYERCFHGGHLVRQLAGEGPHIDMSLFHEAQQL